MASVKFIHILKRLEVIDRDINELKEFLEELSVHRKYSDAIRISLELQINNLLNERVKLMELHIKNAPDNLQEIEFKREISSSNENTFSFQEHEEQYLPRLFNIKENSHNENKKEVHIQSNYPYRNLQAAQAMVKKGSLLPASENSILQKTIKLKEPKSSPKDNLPKTDLNKENFTDIKNLLKKLPTLDY